VARASPSPPKIARGPGGQVKRLDHQAHEVLAISADYTPT